MARRNKRIEHDNHDRWLISYADFITLLFAFFVVMYSISSLNESKYKVFSNSLNLVFSRQQTSAPPSVTSSPQPEQTLSVLLNKNKVLVDKRIAQLGERQRKIQDHMKNLAGELGQVMSILIKQRTVSINQTRRGVVIDISASSLFKTGEAVLQPGVLDVLRQASEVLNKDELPIEVEGHTDDIPIATSQYLSNWELSSARASSVVRILIDNGVSAKRLAVVGLASNQPLVPNDSQENRARNRRVTIVIVSPDMQRGQMAEDR